MRRGFVSCAGMVGAVVLAIGIASANAATSAPGLACPAIAPADWHRGANAKLSEAVVLSVKAGETIDETAPPSLAPDRGVQRGDAWHNLWRIGDDGPGWSYFVDCKYRGGAQVLRLKADGLTQCEQVIRPYDAKKPNENATMTMRCR
jgi:hypothetical protein